MHEFEPLFGLPLEPKPLWHPLPNIVPWAPSGSHDHSQPLQDLPWDNRTSSLCRDQTVRRSLSWHYTDESGIQASSGISLAVGHVQHIPSPNVQHKQEGLDDIELAS